MKSKSLGNIIAAGLALPLWLVAGCDRNNSTPDTTTPTATAADTNAPATVNADNSKQNARDRDDTTLTPGDQGNSDADRQVTRKIRQALVSSTNNYSMTAKNVKIITANGKVTLRGPVNSDTEKTGIETIARNVAGEGNVDNQLEVKTNQ